eukprot:CAMPEP_0202967778 /NCGR_PEP_ID=MMETSP1396-20130829/12771_1 /ASSEMBLY_ACC=CAM_ASM_000872 /TAXON_ID= /ORGANISM="Pseudokeronopsis sp., Strain Brazil" /LENGTH=149 /DNA_ID=CAMNT_0049693231 /DNA_START=22 /DNA_END=471 /DNA_ORIENTATION=-
MSNFEIDGAIPVQATVVEDSVKTVQIPPGLRPGESFIVSPDNSQPFTVIVPEGAAGGSFITVVVPTNASVEDGSTHMKIDKGVAGAAVVGGLIGLVVLGPIGGVIVAGGAAFAATRTESKIGRSVHKVGDTSYKKISSAKNWMMKKLQG